MRKELIVALDLEMNQPSGKIIQVGAVLGSVKTGEVLTTFESKVNPGEVLSETIVELTGIRQNEVNEAPDLPQVYARLRGWLAPYDEKRIMNPLTWGGGDSDTLREALGFDGETWIFGRRWIDAKTLFVSWRLAQGEELQGGLARSMTKLGLAFEGQKHNALDDALNTFRVYRALLKRFKDAELG